MTADDRASAAWPSLPPLAITAVLHAAQQSTGRPRTRCHHGDRSAVCRIAELEAGQNERKKLELQLIAENRRTQELRHLCAPVAPPSISKGAAAPPA